MIFIETDSLNLCVPSKKNLEIWTSWINSSFLRKTVPSTHFPKTIDMQWNWIQSELHSKKRVILEKSITIFFWLLDDKVKKLYFNDEKTKVVKNKKINKLYFI